MLVAVVLAPAILAPPAHAADTDPRQIVPNAIALGGSITGPGLGTPRSITAENAGRFMQSWLGFSIFGQPIKQKPSPGATRYNLTIHQQYRGAKSDLKVFYAVKGRQAWVGMPAQSLGWAFVPKESWIVAPEKTVTTFKAAVGDLPSASPSTPSGRTTSSSGGSSAWVWFVVAGALLVVIALGLMVRRRIRKRDRSLTPAA